MVYGTARGVKIRIIVILALIAIGAGVIVARGVQLQVFEAPRLRAIAARQHQQTIELKAKRGDILDNRGEALALSSMKDTQVYARTEQIQDPTGAAKALAGALGLSAKDRRALADKLSAHDPPFVWITRYATEAQVEAVRNLELPGVGVFPAMRRLYPGGSLASNLLGFTGVEGTGLEGLEFQFERELAGSTIRVWQERDGRGNAIFLTERGSGLSFKPEEKSDSYSGLYDSEAAGGSIRLTVMRPLQFLVEKELEKGVKAARAKAGCVVAMDPQTGRILAMASWPTYDPNRFRESKQENFRNRCVVDAYEPGSTFKVYVTAAALEQGAVGPRDRFFCENGTYAMGGETISDTKAHGWLNLSEIIAVSSNIGASKIGERMGKEKLYNAARSFGFGDKTGIDLPGESGGLLRPWKQWSQIAVGTISFGQGVSATPLQMAAALCAIANGGKLMRPFLVESIIRPDGTELTYRRPELIRRAVSEESARLVTSYMKEVVSDRGTGARAAVPGYSVAGKTGTAQKAKANARGYAEGKYVSSFMGFLPASRPALAMIVIIDEPEGRDSYGGVVAAPVFQAIAKQAMMLLKVPAEQEIASLAMREPVDETQAGRATRLEQWATAREWRSSAPREVRQGEMVMPELTGLTARQAINAFKDQPVSLEIMGTGRVVAQFPAAGDRLGEDSLVRVQLEVES